MNSQTNARGSAAGLLPMLRSIGREMKERNRAIEALDARLAALATTADAHRDEINSIESELSSHRRELRRVEKELKQLGCDIDESNPLRILVPSDEGSWAYEGGLDDTNYYRRVMDVAGDPVF